MCMDRICFHLIFTKYFITLKKHKFNLVSYAFLSDFHICTKIA